MKHPAQVHERDRLKHPPIQRMRDSHHANRARQQPAKMLQSVAYLVGVGKTHLATALGHMAIRRRLIVYMAHADHLFKRFKPHRLDNSAQAEHRCLAAVNLLIIDDLAL